MDPLTLDLCKQGKFSFDRTAALIETKNNAYPFLRVLNLGSYKTPWQNDSRVVETEGPYKKSAQSQSTLILENMLFFQTYTGIGGC